MSVLSNKYCYIENFEIDSNKIVDTNATDILAEIQHIIKDDTLNDFEMIEKIVKFWYA